MLKLVSDGERLICFDILCRDTSVCVCACVCVCVCVCLLNLSVYILKHRFVLNLDLRSKAILWLSLRRFITYAARKRILDLEQNLWEHRKAPVSRI